MIFTKNALKIKQKSSTKYYTIYFGCVVPACCYAVSTLDIVVLDTNNFCPVLRRTENTDEKLN